MLRFFVSTIGLTLLLGLAGCGDPNAGALFADIQYATRCEVTVGACEGAENRDICGFNLSDPCEGFVDEAAVSCSVRETADTRTINFSARQGTGYSISISDLQVPHGGGSAGGAECRVTVVEGVNTYTGLCGGSPASAAQPCQITNVAFSDDMGNPQFEGDIFCQHLTNRATPSLEIEVTAIGSGPDPASRPGRFRLVNCSGQTL